MSPDGELYIVTDFVKNGSLLEFLQKKGSILSIQQRMDLFIDAAKGMAYLESKKVIHRDLAC